MMVLEMRSVLTREQRAKLAQLRAERREHQRRKERQDNAQEPSRSKHETLPGEGGGPSGRSVAVNAAAYLGFTAYMLLFVGVPGSFYFNGPTAAAHPSRAALRAAASG